MPHAELAEGAAVREAERFEEALEWAREGLAGLQRQAAKRLALWKRASSTRRSSCWRIREDVE